jgi:hypothetical protein
VHPEFLDTITDTDQRYKVPNDKLRQLRTKGCQYKLTETQIRDWLHLYGSVQGDIMEEAVLYEVNGALMGTGSYLAFVNLSK